MVSGVSILLETDEVMGADTRIAVNVGDGWVEVSGCLSVGAGGGVLVFQEVR